MKQYEPFEFGVITQDTGELFEKPLKLVEDKIYNRFITME